MGKYIVSALAGIIAGFMMDVVAHTVLGIIMPESFLLQSISKLIGLVSGISTALEILRHWGKT